MRTILKQKLVFLAFCLLVMGAQSCCNEKAATIEVEGFNLIMARTEIQAANENFWP